MQRYFWGKVTYVRMFISTAYLFFKQDLATRVRNR